MASIPGYKAQVYITTTPAVAFTNEATTDAGDHKTFSITNQVKRYWDDTQALTVQTSPDGTTWTTVTTGFTVQYVGGIITFASAVTGATPSVRVSGFYWPYSILGGAKSAEVQVQQTILDVTNFSSGGWMEKIAGIADATVKLSRFWFDAFFLNGLTNRMVVSVYTGANANQRLEGFAYIKTDNVKVDVKAAIEENIDFEIDGHLYAVLS